MKKLATGLLLCCAALASCNDKPEINPDSNLQVYPNPSSGVFTASVNVPQGEAKTLRLFDTEGNEVQDIDLTAQPAGSNQVSFNIETSPAGYYTLALETTKTTFTVRVLKQ